MITIKDLARELGIGVSTVSMALNNNPRIKQETRELVAKKAQELGYVKNGIAVDLQKRRTNLILLVVDDASRPFFSKVINEVQKEVACHNYDFLISTTFQGHDQTARRYISEHRADGAIIYTKNIDDDFIRQYASADFPIFVLGRYLRGDYVHSRKSSFSKSVFAYLIEQGFERIAFVKADPNTLGTSRRFENYKAVLEKKNIPLREEIIFDAGSSKIEDGYRVTLEILKKLDQIDIIFYANDDIAIGGIHALKEHHIRIPEDISIMGYGDTYNASLVEPSLTTVSTGEETSAKLAVAYLNAVILNQDHQAIIDKYNLIQYNESDLIVHRESMNVKK